MVYITIQGIAGLSATMVQSILVASLRTRTDKAVERDARFEKYTPSPQ
jgi:hypothetical protein